MPSRGPKPLPLAVRFWRKVLILGSDDCWPWQGFCEKAYGYGKLTLYAPDGRPVPRNAHRIAFALHHGRDLFSPSLLHILHRCDNPPCCNPAHLWEGTNLDNRLDSKLKGRVPKGAQHWHARLTPEIVLEMRKLHAGGDTYEAIAGQFGVSIVTAYDAILKRTWGHLGNHKPEP